jgi:hypothetical protein
MRGHSGLAVVAFASAVLLLVLVPTGAPATAFGSAAQSPPLVFPSAAIPDLDTHVGEHIYLSLCHPIPLPGRDCGGPFVHNQRVPRGGSPAGPYVFTRGGGFLPPGIVLHSNGLVTGTIRPTQKIDWFFTVCVRVFGTSESTCQSGSVWFVEPSGTKPKPKPKPTPKPTPTANPYDGDWVGALTGIVSWQTAPVTTENINIPVANAGVTDGTLLLDNATDANGSIFNVEGDDQGDDAQIPASGLVALTFWPDLEIDSGISNNLGYFSGCNFSMQFTKTGTATAVGKITCNSSGPSPASFTGTLSLTRTS